MTKTVNSYRFLNFAVKKLVKSWIGMEKPRDIPWTPLSRPINECTVALISSAGIALKSDQPFDQEGERQNPWWGDPSFRIIPKTATEKDVSIYHLHIDSAYAQKDLNCLLPLQRLLDLEETDEIGCSAKNHYSYMGYILEPKVLLEENLPPVIQSLKDDKVDLVILVPG